MIEILLAGTAALAVFLLLVVCYLGLLVFRQRHEAAGNAAQRAAEIKAWQDAKATREALAEDERLSTRQHAYVPPPPTPEMQMSLAIQAAMQNQVEAANGRPHTMCVGSNEVFANEEGAVFVHGPVPPAEGSLTVIRPDCGTVEVRYDKPFHTGEGISPVPLPGHRCGVSADKPKCYVAPRCERLQGEVEALPHAMDAAELDRRIAADKAYRERLGLEAAQKMADIEKDCGREAADAYAANNIHANLTDVVTRSRFGPPADVADEVAATS